MQSQRQKWEVVATSSKLQGVSPDQAWSLLGDYYNMHKFIPSIIPSSKKIGEGLRHHAISMPIGAPPAYFAKDRLLKMDKAQRSYSYEVIENNMGLGKVLFTLKVAPADRDGCRIEWSAVTEPAPGWTRSDFENFPKTGVAEASKIVAAAVRAGTK